MPQLLWKMKNMPVATEKEENHAVATAEEVKCHIYCRRGKTLVVTEEKENHEVATVEEEVKTCRSYCG